MEYLAELFESLRSQSIREIPFLIVLALVAAGLSAAWWILLRRDPRVDSEQRLPSQLVMIGLWIASAVAVVITLPVSESTRSGLLSLLSVVLSAAIALSSTTFIGNAIAGLMLRSIGSFGPGDFVRVADHFGRVTQRGLVHTEIQTEDRDLTTLPNLFLVQNPVRVVRRSGTIVSATVSLGYDVTRSQIEEQLLLAAERAELSDAFVQVAELGDFSVSYRVAGFLSDVRHLLTTRSTLRKCMLDSLHEAQIEIVSPTFMNQRQLEAAERAIPTTHRALPPEPENGEPDPEEVIFDKADAAAQVETLKTELAEAKRELAAAEEDDDLKSQSQSLRGRIATIETHLQKARASEQDD